MRLSRTKFWLPCLLLAIGVCCLLRLCVPSRRDSLHAQGRQDEQRKAEGVRSIEKKTVAVFPPPGAWDDFQLGEIVRRDWRYGYPRSYHDVRMRFAFCRDGTVGYAMNRKCPAQDKRLAITHATFVVDGKPGPSFASVTQCEISGPGTILKYRAGTTGWPAEVIVRKPLHVALPGLSATYSSADGKKEAYVIKPNWYLPRDHPERNRCFASIEGESGELFDVVGAVSFNADGSRHAYFADSEKQNYIVVDGVKRELPFRPLYLPVFGPDGKTIAYAASSPDWTSEFVVSNHERLDTHDFEGGYQPVGDIAPSANPLMPRFSSVGEIVYAAVDVALKKDDVLGKNRDKGWVIVSNGIKTRPAREVRDCDSIELLGVSPDGQPVYRGDETIPFRFFVGETERDRIVLDTGDVVSLKTVYCPFFLTSTNGSRMAYAAEDEQGGMFVVCEDLTGIRKGKTFTWVSDQNIVISPDGRHIAYSAKEGDSYLAVIDDIELEPRSVDPIDCIYFSDDGAKLFFGTFDGHNLWWHTVTLNK